MNDDHYTDGTPRRKRRKHRLDTARGLQAALREGATPDRSVAVSSPVRGVMRVTVRDTGSARLRRELVIEFARDELDLYLIEICQATWHPDLPHRRVVTLAAQDLTARANSRC